VRRALPAIAAVLLAGCSAVPAARPVAPHAAPYRLLVGAADSGYQAFASATGVKPAIVEHYIHPFEPLPLAFAGPAEPLVQIEPRHAPLAQVTAGRYDGWLRSLAAQAKAYGRPVILGWAPEANGPWYSWGYKSVAPAVYIAAWRHVVTVFRQAGASNVTWLWTVNVASPGVSSPALWWPGAAWTGMTGLDGYIDTAAQAYGSKIAPTVALVRTLSDHPVILSETAVAAVAGKPAKIADLFAGARRDRLAALVWFDLPGNKDWPVDGDAAAVAAFRTAAKENH
jgi:hypothetical protein